MTGRRPLAELLGELADGAAVFAHAAGDHPVRARSLSVGVPIELRLVPTEAGVEVIGDLPLFRTRTDFDPEPARLRVEWRAVPRAGDEAS